MCLHSFIKSHREHLFYCNKCGCISINQTPFNTLSSYETSCYSNPLLFLSQQKTIEDNKSLQFNPSYKSQYLSIRLRGINSIKRQVDYLKLSQRIMYKAILYMDLIYMAYFIYISSIENVASVCVLFALQFTDSCSFEKMAQIVKHMNEIRYFHQLEILCLKNLDYDLGQLSAYDYLMNMFAMGISSSYKLEIIDKAYNDCLGFLGQLLEDNRFIDFSPYEISFSIIKIQCGRKAFFSLKQFAFAYDVNYSNDSLLNSTFVLSIIKKYTSNKKPYDMRRRRLLKTHSNTSCSTQDSS